MYCKRNCVLAVVKGRGGPAVIRRGCASAILDGAVSKYAGVQRQHSQFNTYESSGSRVCVSVLSPAFLPESALSARPGWRPRVAAEPGLVGTGTPPSDESVRPEFLPASIDVDMPRWSAS